MVAVPPRFTAASDGAGDPDALEVGACAGAQAAAANSAASANASPRRFDASLMSLSSSCHASQSGIEDVTQRIAEQIEAKDRERDCDPREDRHPGSDLEVRTRRSAEHVPPRRLRRLHAEPEERQRGF